MVTCAGTYDPILIAIAMVFGFVLGFAAGVFVMDGGEE